MAYESNSYGNNIGNDLNNNFNDIGFGNRSDVYGETNTSLGADSNFLESNNIFAKLAFLLVLLFAFIMLFRIGVALISWLFTTSNSPHLIDGVVSGNQQKIIYQDPSATNSKPIYRSVNQSKGIEFTWSVWIYINSIDTSKSEYSTIFYKGNNNMSDTGLNFPNNAPGLYLEPGKNNLMIVMNTFSSINEEISVPDIPLNKWVNVIIRCQNRTLDVYINGNIARSLTLTDVPKQNYGNVYIATNGGFDGNISDLWYFNYSLGPGEITNLVRKGPNTKAADIDSLSTNSKYDYLSLQWYFFGNSIGM